MDECIDTFVDAFTNLAEALTRFRDDQVKPQLRIPLHFPELPGKRIDCHNPWEDALENLGPVIRRATMSTRLLMVVFGGVPVRDHYQGLVEEFPKLMAKWNGAQSPQGSYTRFIVAFRKAYPSIRRIMKLYFDPEFLKFGPYRMAVAMHEISRKAPRKPKPAPYSMFATFGGFAEIKNENVGRMIYSYYATSPAVMSASGPALEALLCLTTYAELRRKAGMDLELVDCLMQQVIDWTNLSRLMAEFEPPTDPGYNPEEDLQDPAGCAYRVAMVLTRLVMFNGKEIRNHVATNKRAKRCAAGLATVEALYEAMDRLIYVFQVQGKFNRVRKEEIVQLEALKIMIGEVLTPELATTWKAWARPELSATLEQELKAAKEAGEVVAGLYDNCMKPANEMVGEIEKLQRCSRCKMVWYCSSECQREGWSEHKLDCGWRARFTSVAPTLWQTIYYRDTQTIKPPPSLVCPNSKQKTPSNRFSPTFPLLYSLLGTITANSSGPHPSALSTASPTFSKGYSCTSNNPTSNSPELINGKHFHVVCTGYIIFPITLQLFAIISM